MRGKESTAISITLPAALDRALQELANGKHCGNKSAAIRAILYKEAGVELRVSESNGVAEIAKAERRAAKYGRRRKKR